jgi:hypothetical protein
MSLILSGTDGLSDVDGSAATPAIRGTDANTGIFFGSDIIGFTEGGTEAMRLNSSGNVGIGTSSPAYRLQVVNGTSNYAALGNGASSGGASALFMAGASNQLSWAMCQNFHVAGALTFAPSTANGGFTLTNPYLTLNNTGAVVLKDGNTSATGTGIAFPATQSASSDANTLDDYEEGTWTPILGRFTTDPTITYSDRRGTYVKIGSMVYCMAFFNISSISANGSGLNQLAGFPFTPESVGSSRWVLNVGLNECLTTAISGYIIAGATFGFFYNTTNQSNPNANYATGQMFISFSYQTT